MAFKRLPNGLGNVSKLSGNRRKPWRARRTIGYEPDDENRTTRQVYETIGYYETKKEAIEALVKNGHKKMNVQAEKYTFGDILDMMTGDPAWKHERNITYGIKNVEPLRNKNFLGLTVTDYEEFFEHANIARTMRKRSLDAIRRVYAFAIRKGITNDSVIDKAVIEKNDRAEIKRTPFTREEVEAFDNYDCLVAKTLKIGVYTGMRESELFLIKKQNIHIDERYMIGGMKTEAGTDRVIPIHKEILPLIKELMETDSEYPMSGYDGDKSKDVFAMKKFLDKNFPGHTSHEMRVTFITNAYKCGMNHMIVQKIVGHKTGDITMDTYTKLQPKDLVAEMDRYFVS